MVRGGFCGIFFVLQVRVNQQQAIIEISASYTHLSSNPDQSVQKATRGPDKLVSALSKLPFQMILYLLHCLAQNRFVVVLLHHSLQIRARQLR